MDTDRRRRLYQLGAVLVSAIAIAAVVATVLGSGSTAELAPGRPVPGAAKTLALLRGIPQSGLSLGRPDAPLTLVEIGDLQCPACASFAVGALPTLVSRYVRSGRLRLVFRGVTFLGQDSLRALRMADALGHQDRLWQFVELMYCNQGLENSSYVTERYLRALAGAIPGADAGRALREGGSPAVAAQIARSRALARREGIRATPSFLLSRAGGPLARLHPSGLDAAAFTGPLGRLLRAR